MKPKITQLLFLIAPIYFYSCSSVAPITNHYERAATLKKGNVELAGNFTSYSVAGVDESESVNNNFGFRAGYGISDKVDIKFDMKD